MISNLDTNRSFLYGDGFFETFKLIDGKCERLDLHYQRIIQSISVLKMVWNKEWTQTFFEEKLKAESKNFEVPILKVRIIFYRDSKGTYTPETDLANYYIKIEPYTPTNKTILKAGLYTLAKKPVNFLSGLKSTSCLMFVMAAKYAKEMGWDEVIFLNEYGRVCEALTSNIFIKKEEIFYTPPLSEGCIDGVNRRAFLSENKNIIQKPIEVEELKNYQIYFSNAVRGMIAGELIYD
ncbi:MAG: aminotransferase class IV [Bacteroidia bacterium]